VKCLDDEAHRQHPFGKGSAPFLLPPEEEEGEASQRAHGDRVKWRCVAINECSINGAFGYVTRAESHRKDSFGEVGIFAAL